MKPAIAVAAIVWLAATTPLVASAQEAGSSKSKSAASPAPEITIDRDNIVLKSSVRIKPGVYVVEDADRNGVLQIAADDVVVDFRGATLASRKNVQTGDKEQYDGIGVAVGAHERVVVKDAKIYGYRFNLKAEGCEQLLIENCDCSHSRAQRISKNGRPIDIFLDLRHVAAWREYGSAIWLENCEKSSVAGCRAHASQNGICLVDSDGCTVNANDMSFNSGWGIALSSSENNAVTWNHADFCNRPCQRGGGDNAGIAVVNGSHQNFVVGNSMTYGGDGFFLTDGENMGVRPSSDNVIAWNDCSWADAVALEGTFSERNVYYKNQASDSRYGFWLGWSFNNLVLENTIERNSHDGVAIGCGQFNRIEGNRFVDTGAVPIHVWTEDQNVGLSRQYWIVGNAIENSRQALLLEKTTEYFIDANRLKNAPLPPGLASTMKKPERTGRQVFEGMPAFKRVEEIVAAKPKNFKYFRQESRLQGRELVRHGDFAPVDFRSGQRGAGPRRR